MSRYNEGNSIYEDTKETLCLDPVDGGWSEWSDFSECSKTCGTGSQSRERTCTNPKPAHGGKDCQGEKLDMDTCRRPCVGVGGGGGGGSGGRKKSDLENPSLHHISSSLGMLIFLSSCRTYVHPASLV